MIISHIKLQSRSRKQKKIMIWFDVELINELLIGILQYYSNHIKIVSTMICSVD